ncbi:MAG: DUF1624 domain-containing protein [Anaerolineales bacterium]|nr:DUF1624 domain-containing protein [Anaerolineales bacterium]
MTSEKSTKSSTTNTRSSGSRFQPLDILRGLIMVIMAVDHVSFFIARVHFSEYWGVQLPLYTDALSFITRFITHQCAPGFFFLMGAGIVLLTASRKRKGWNERRITSFLSIRGSILIAVELLVLNFAWMIGGMRGVAGSAEPPGGGSDYTIFYFGILCCLGCNLILCGLLRNLEARILFGLSVITMIASQLLIPPAANADVLYNPLLRLLLIPGQTGLICVMYPIIPWLGVTMWGMIFGKLLLTDEKKGFRFSLVLSIVLLALFVTWRIPFGGGDFHSPVSNTWIGYLNLTKYPPSIAFISLTMGVNLLLLFGLSKIENTAPLKILGVFGRVPFFFYVSHIALYTLAGAFTLHYEIAYPLLYLSWLLSLVLLYPLCVWFGKLKIKAPAESIIRFF